MSRHTMYYATLLDKYGLHFPYGKGTVTAWSMFTTRS